MSGHPRLVHTVVDATDARQVAEFYRELLGLVYRKGNEQPPGGDEDPPGWLVLLTPEGENLLAFQRVESLTRTTWPDDDVPMQMHLCFYVEPDDLEHQRERALQLGAELLLHRTDEPEEPLYVLADPAGHPFCLYTHPGAGQ